MCAWVYGMPVLMKALGAEGQTLPVLVVAGEHDPALGPETCKATWLQHYPNARLEVMANAGHYPMDETPVALATVIEKFLREAVAARAGCAPDEVVLGNGTDEVIAMIRQIDIDGLRLPSGHLSHGLDAEGQTRLNSIQDYSRLVQLLTKLMTAPSSQSWQASL